MAVTILTSHGVAVICCCFIKYFNKLDFDGRNGLYLVLSWPALPESHQIIVSVQEVTIVTMKVERERESEN